MKKNFKRNNKEIKMVYENSRLARPDRFAYLKSLKKKAEEQKKIFSKENFLADEIWNFFKQEIAFPRIMKIIKEKGYQAVYQIFNEVRRSKSKNPPALFLWKIKKEKIIWKNS